MLHLAELFDSSIKCVMRRDSWPEKVYIYGINARVIEAKDVESTLCYDPIIVDYLQINGHSGDLTLRKRVEIVDAEGTSRPWTPAEADLYADDWTVQDYSELIKKRRS